MGKWRTFKDGKGVIHKSFQRYDLVSIQNKDMLPIFKQQNFYAGFVFILIEMST